MTNRGLARSYFKKARARLDVLELLLHKGAWSDVVREAQEIVELSLKGILREAGVEPPKLHDVGPIVVENAGLLPEGIRARAERLAEISRWLRGERELAFCGDDDFIPTEEYDEQDAVRAGDDALFVVDTAAACISEPSA
jgi:HEPN domain-containing protein